MEKDVRFAICEKTGRRLSKAIAGCEEASWWTWWQERPSGWSTLTLDSGAEAAQRAVETDPRRRVLSWNKTEMIDDRDTVADAVSLLAR